MVLSTPQTPDKKLSERTKVLVVDDEPMLLLFSVEVVEEAGFEAICAANADEAIKILIARDDIDIMFTDIRMPGSMDGLKLATAVRDRWPPIRIIVTSSRIGAAPEGLPAHSRFFQRPYRPEQVISALHDLAA